MSSTRSRALAFGTADPARIPPAAPSRPEAARAGLPPRRRAWTINGDFLTLEPTGIARCGREICAALDAMVGEGHPETRDLALEIVAPRVPARPLALQHIPLRIVPEWRYPRLPQAWVQLQLPAQVRGGLVSFANLAPVGLRRQIVCIHDLQTRLAPESYSRAFRLLYGALLPRIGRRAARIVTVSELSRSHLVEHAVADAEKIVVVHNGSDHALAWGAAGAAFTGAGARPYVLCMGRPQAHKNPELFLKIAPALDAMGIDLVMTGSAAIVEHLRIEAQRPANLRFVGRLDDAAFAAALDGALCFLLPSRTEGFGLPAAEAMARGCPVVASTAPSLPEVCADAALYADPEAPDAWVAAIAALRAGPDLRADLVARGRARAAHLTWRRVAERYLALMREVDATFETT